MICFMGGIVLVDVIGKVSRDLPDTASEFVLYMS